MISYTFLCYRLPHSLEYAKPEVKATLWSIKQYEMKHLHLFEHTLGSLQRGQTAN